MLQIEICIYHIGTGRQVAIARPVERAIKERAINRNKRCRFAIMTGVHEAEMHFLCGERLLNESVDSPLNKMLSEPSPGLA